MAVTSITATTSSSRLCHYVLNGAAHDGSGNRRYVFASGLGCFAPIAAQAFAITRTVRGQQGIIRQAYSVVQSFSREEVDMDDPESAERVHELGLELARRAFPGHQVLVVTQRDGKSGLLHNHIVVSNISDRDAELVYRRKPRSNSFRDKVALLHGSPDGLIEVREERPAGRAFSSAMGNRHRLAHINDELLADMEFMQSLGLKAYDNKALMAPPPERITKDDRAKREKGDYVWRDDLKRIISEEQRQAVSVDDFRDRLAARRVELRERGKERHFSYGFVDADGKSRQARALGVRGLGAAFGRDATVPLLKQNRSAKAKMAQPSPSVHVAFPGNARRQEKPVEGSVASTFPAVDEHERWWLDGPTRGSDTSPDVYADAEISAPARGPDAASIAPIPRPVLDLVEATDPPVVSVPKRRVVQSVEQKRWAAMMAESAAADDHGLG
ncbi:MAG: relaxase/mobilization nuclease domain-containing protein [Arthrobacter sp.]